jgi:hypothetical protein
MGEELMLPMHWLGKVMIGFGGAIALWAWIIERTDWMVSLPCLMLIWCGIQIEVMIDFEHRKAIASARREENDS